MAIQPVDTFLNSEIKYPSSIFTLSKHEVFPYERLAFNILKIGVEALHNVELPESLIVDYTQLPAVTAPWTINASISSRVSDSGRLIGFTVNLPEFFPAILHLYVHVVAQDFFDSKNISDYQADHKLLGTKIQEFIDAISVGVKSYKNESSSIGIAVRKSYEFLNFRWNQLHLSMNHFDSLTQLIANHEIAHAYVGQLYDWKGGPSLDFQAYELIADLLSTEWFYNLIVKNTPTSTEYLEFRGFDSYSDAVSANTLLATEVQLSLLMLMAIAGAQHTGGLLSLEGGASHPHGLLRYKLQYVHLMTLVESNFADVVQAESIHFIDSQWKTIMDILIRSGLIAQSDIDKLFDAESIHIIERAAEIILENDIKELEKVATFLQSYHEILSQLKEKRKK